MRENAHMARCMIQARSGLCRKIKRFLQGHLKGKKSGFKTRVIIQARTREARMTIDRIDITATIEQVKELLRTEQGLSPALKSGLQTILMIVTLLLNRLGLNSRNSSKPPSTNPNRVKKRRASTGRKPGGQSGHNGKTLLPVPDPEKSKSSRLTAQPFPRGDYRDVGYESRQVVDLDISKIVVEWQAHVVENEQGNGLSRHSRKGLPGRFSMELASRSTRSICLSTS